MAGIIILKTQRRYVLSPLCYLPESILEGGPRGEINILKYSEKERVQRLDSGGLHKQSPIKTFGLIVQKALGLRNGLVDITAFKMAH